MTSQDTYEIFRLEGKPMSEFGMGHTFSAIEELQVGTDTLVIRFDSDMSPSTLISPRYDNASSFRCWYMVFGWKASEPYHSDDMKLSALRVRPIRSTDHAFIEQQLRAHKKIGASVRIVIKDWSTP